jgi:hypothetical protein
VKRIVALVSVALLVGLAGCVGPAANSGPSGPSTAATSTTAPAGGAYAPISLDGPQEKKAAAALPSALKTAADSVKSQGKTPPDLSGATATLVSYQLQARVDDQIALFEVRADGRAYEMFRYPTPPNPKTLKWSPIEYAEGSVLTDPASNPERAAVAAVTSIVKTARPSSTPVVKISGYTFFWISSEGTPVETKDGGPFSLMVDPDGEAAGWSL